MKWRGRLQNLRDLGELTLRWVIIALLFSIPVKAHGKKATGKKAPSAVEDLTLKEGDEKSNDMRALKTEMLVAKSETLAISQINKLIKKYKGTSMEADMWFRLAELHMRRSKTERFFEIHRTSETVVSLAPNQARNASSKKAVMEAISVYEMIERKFKTYPEMDLVVFNSAFARQTIGQTKEAEATYWRLIRTFPRSYLIPDAHLAIGEMAFDGKRFQLALDHFEAIKKYPESRVYPYGLYKAAWSHYNLRQPGEGLKELEKTVEYGRKVAESGDENKLDLRKEALMDMTVFFEDVHQASIAYNYFKAQAAELDFAPYLIRLSDLYKRHSRFDDRKVLLSEFVKRSDESSYVPRAHEELIWNYDHLKDKVAAVKQMTALEKVCHPKSSWLRAQKPEPGTPPEALPGVECSHRLRDVTLKLANRWLAMWKKNLTYPDFADSSERAYEIYLVHALPGDEASQARFAYSELLFQRNKFREASHHYALVGQGTTDAKLRHDSQYAAIVSLEKAVKDQWSAKDEEQYYKLAKTYLDGNPKGQYVADIEFKSALIHYEKSRYDQAAPLFVKLGNATPATEKSLKAQDLYLDILNIKKDYEGLKAYSKTLAKGPQTPERKAKLQTIYEQAFFLQVQKAEESGDVATAVAGYQKFTQENPKSPLAEKALWNSVQLQFKASSALVAARAAMDFQERFPQSTHSTDALLKAAESFESMAQLEEAAQVVQKLALIDKASEFKWKMLAADFYSLAGRTILAKNLYIELRKAKDKDMGHEAMLKLEHMEKHHGTKQAHEALLREMLHSQRQPQASLAALHFLEVTFADKKWTKSFEDAKDILNMGPQAAVRAKSRARFIQAKILEDEFRAQSVKSRLERLPIVLAIKTEKLEKAQSGYQSAMRYGDPLVAVEALRQLAGCYGHYSDSLRKMEMPAELTAEEKEALRTELERLAIPMEERQVETMAEALLQAKRLKIHNGWVAEIQAEMDRLNMKKTDPIPTLSPPAMALPRYVGAR